MNILLLITIILGVALQNAAKKHYTRKCGNKGVYLLSAFTTLFAAMFFLITSNKLEWNIGVVLYSIAFAISFLFATLFVTLSICNGSLSLTSLITSYSLMLPTFYGIIFLKEEISFFLPVGLGLLAVSLFLINKKSSDFSVNTKWVLYVLLAFLGNGMCSVFQKMQQIKFDGAYKNEFMIIALLTAAVILFIISLSKEKKHLKCVFKEVLIPSGVSGLMSGVVNLFVMILSGTMSVSIMFPLISAGGIVVTFLISLMLYKEKFSKLQLLGFIAGVLSIIFLNI